MASSAAAERLMSIPIFLFRSMIMATDVALTGSITELISGGAPRPDSSWHPWQFRR